MWPTRSSSSRQDPGSSGSTCQRPPGSRFCSRRVNGPGSISMTSPSLSVPRVWQSISQVVAGVCSQTLSAREGITWSPAGDASFSQGALLSPCSRLGLVGIWPGTVPPTCRRCERVCRASAAERAYRSRRAGRRVAANRADRKSDDDARSDRPAARPGGGRGRAARMALRDEGRRQGVIEGESAHIKPLAA